MATRTFSQAVNGIEELRSILGEPQPVSIKKQIGHLDKHCRAFISLSPFLLIGTSNSTGRCDVSPKGDAPGFVQVLDDHTLVIPERPGNRRADTLANILENPHVGLLFIVPGVEDTLRVNGQATIVMDEELLDLTAHQGKRPVPCKVPGRPPRPARAEGRTVSATAHYMAERVGFELSVRLP